MKRKWGEIAVFQIFLPGFYFFTARETSSDEELCLAPVVPTRGEEVFESPTDVGDDSVPSDEQYWGGFSGTSGAWVFY